MNPSRRWYHSRLCPQVPCRLGIPSPNGRISAPLKIATFSLMVPPLCLSDFPRQPQSASYSFNTATCLLHRFGVPVATVEIG